jgi:hypothetical protein
MMRFLAGVVRVSVVGSLCLFVMAVGIGRLLPKVPPDVTNARRHARSSYLEITNFAVFRDQSRCRFLDPDTGRYVNLGVGRANMLLYGTSTPWQKDGEEVQVAGLWMGRDPETVARGFSEFGIIRCAFPSGRLIDEIPLEIFPIGNICWFPEPPARVLFAGTNGKLYRGTFPGDADLPPLDPDGESESASGTHVAPLRWGCDPPGGGVIRMSDPFWSTDPRMKDRLLVSLSYRVGSGREARYTPAKLWWLQIDEGATTIQAAGPLVAASGADELVEEERLPSVSATPNGGLALAYLRRDKNSSHWDLRLAPITLDDDSGQPSVQEVRTVRLAEDVAIAQPAFSTSGEWVYGIPLANVSMTHAERFSVTKALTQTTASHPTRQTHLGHARAGSHPVGDHDHADALATIDQPS